MPFAGRRTFVGKNPRCSLERAVTWAASRWGRLGKDRRETRLWPARSAVEFCRSKAFHSPPPNPPTRGVVKRYRPRAPRNERIRAVFVTIQPEGPRSQWRFFTQPSSEQVARLLSTVIAHLDLDAFFA